jgi:hypothetical protein
MGKINREELFKILDEQHERCKSNLAEIMDDNIQKLHNYHGDVIDIKTEIILGQDLEHSLFRLVDEDYYDKQKLLSSESVQKGTKKDISVLTDIELDVDSIWKPICKYEPTTTTVTAPKHKKKYLIKLNDDLTHERVIEIAQEIEEQQFICYNKGTIEQIITLDVE